MGVLHQFGGFAENRCFLRKHLSGMRTKSMVHRGWIECVVGAAGGAEVAALHNGKRIDPEVQFFPGPRGAAAKTKDICLWYRISASLFARR